MPVSAPSHPIACRQHTRLYGPSQFHDQGVGGMRCGELSPETRLDSATHETRGGEIIQEHSIQLGEEAARELSVEDSVVGWAHSQPSAVRVASRVVVDPTVDRARGRESLLRVLEETKADTCVL